MGRASYQSVTWAVFFLDVDLDGHLDIFAANGGTDESQGMLDSRARLRQPPLLLLNRGDGTFDDVSQATGEAFGRYPVVETLEVTWPSGVTQRFTDIAPKQSIVVDESAGEMMADPRLP